MNFAKLFKKVQPTQVVMVIAAVVLGYALLNYSRTKGLVHDNMADGENNYVASNSGSIPPHIENPPKAPGLETQIDTAGNPVPSQPIEQVGGPAMVSGLDASVKGLPPSCARQQVVDPAELLPRDQNSEWARLNPIGSGDLQHVNLLKSGYHIGINTVSSTLRNANLQLRSEPPNPQLSVGPWNNTTISPDINRRPLEIGSQA